MLSTSGHLPLPFAQGYLTSDLVPGTSSSPQGVGRLRSAAGYPDTRPIFLDSSQPEKVKHLLAGFGFYVAFPFVLSVCPGRIFIY